MYQKSPPKTTLRDERLAKLREALCRLEQIPDTPHADEEFIRQSRAILEYAESILPDLALKRASKSPYLAKVHQATWSNHHGE